MIGFQSSVLAGTVLVRSAIQSPNYVPSVSGWTINQDGSAEFNDVQVRGDLIVNGANDGFIAIQNDGGQATIYLQPEDPTGTQLPAQVFAKNIGTGGATVGQLQLESPHFTGGSTTTIALTSESQDGVSFTSEITLYNSQSEPLLVRVLGALFSTGTLTAGGNAVVQGNLTVSGTFSRPNCLVSVGTGSIPTGGAPTVLPLTVIKDSYSMVSGGTVVIPRNGTYNVGCELRFASQAAVVGFRQAGIVVNGVAQQQMNIAPTTALNATNTMSTVLHPMDMVAGDVVTFTAFHTAGAALNLIAGSRAWVQLEEG